MNKSISNLIIGSIILGVTAGFYSIKREKAKKNDAIKPEIEIFKERKYYKVADIYRDDENNIQFKKVI